MQPLLSKATLMVVPDPWASPLDAQGFPVAFVAYDPEYLPKGTIRYIGAVLERKVDKPRNISALRDSGNQQQYSRVTTTVRYDLTPARVVHSAYHQQMVKLGALLPADAETARRCGVKFVPPVEVIEASISARIAEWCSANPGETIDPANWFAVPEGEKPPLVRGLAFAPRQPVTGSTVEERIAAIGMGRKVLEGDGLAKEAMPGDILVGTDGVGNSPPTAKPSGTGASGGVAPVVAPPAETSNEAVDAEVRSTP